MRHRKRAFVCARTWAYTGVYACVRCERASGCLQAVTCRYCLLSLFIFLSCYLLCGICVACVRACVLSCYLFSSSLESLGFLSPRSFFPLSAVVRVSIAPLYQLCAGLISFLLLRVACVCCSLIIGVCPLSFSVGWA